MRKMIRDHGHDDAATSRFRPNCYTKHMDVAIQTALNELHNAVRLAPAYRVQDRRGSSGRSTLFGLQSHGSNEPHRPIHTEIIFGAWHSGMPASLAFNTGRGKLSPGRQVLGLSVCSSAEQASASSVGQRLSNFTKHDLVSTRYCMCSRILFHVRRPGPTDSKG